VTFSVFDLYIPLDNKDYGSWQYTFVNEEGFIRTVTIYGAESCPDWFDDNWFPDATWVE
jgi:hypothetical protein